MEPTLLNFLLSQGAIQEADISRINQYAAEQKLGLVASTINVAKVSETKLARFVALFYALPRFKYENFEVDVVATELVSGIIAVRLGLLPYRFGPQGELYIVCSDPEAVYTTVNEIKRLVPGGEIKLEIGPLSAVRELAAFVYYGRFFDGDFNERVGQPEHDDTLFLTQDKTSKAVMQSQQAALDGDAILEELNNRIANIDALEENSEAGNNRNRFNAFAAREKSLKEVFNRNSTKRQQSPIEDERRRVLMIPSANDSSEVFFEDDPFEEDFFGDDDFFDRPVTVSRGDYTHAAPLHGVNELAQSANQALMTHVSNLEKRIDEQDETIHKLTDSVHHLEEQIDTLKRRFDHE